jgi:hypothetical protein
VESALHDKEAINLGIIYGCYKTLCCPIVK